MLGARTGKQRPGVLNLGSVSPTVTQTPAQPLHMLSTCAWSLKSSLHMGHGCAESPCRTDLCFTLSHSAGDSGSGGGAKRPSFCAVGQIAA